MKNTDSKIILALDYDNASDALALVEQLDPALCKLKVGKELFTREGPALVKRLVAGGFPVFLDLKFHDIPNTTAKAVAAAADMGVWMVNVHASGGARMMEACVRELQLLKAQTLLIGVTVLTSMSSDELADVGVAGDAAEQVLRLASLAHRAGLDGVVCSAQEARHIADTISPDFLRVTPGIRPAFAAEDDQKRIMTPAEAVAGGSSYLVIGRPVTRAVDPLGALLAIREEIGEY